MLRKPTLSYLAVIDLIQSILPLCCMPSEILTCIYDLSMHPINSDIGQRL